jgi:glyoxalase family protein
MNSIQGIHHITAVASDPQVNVDFYEQILGQRLVKTTVNFDDPGTYHLYYGDEVGSPGTILTFFPWMHMGRGRRGTGETVAIAYRVPAGSIDYWAGRLAENGIDILQTEERFGELVIGFDDPDGMRIELTASNLAESTRVWSDGPVPEEHAIRGFHGVTLALSSIEATATLLTRHLGYRLTGEEGDRYRYRAGSDAAAFLDLEHRPDEDRGRFGAGSIHHVAFRTVDDEEQREYQRRLREAGQDVTGVKDRQYFHSIYFREPGGVLFEIATDEPGFLVDESIEDLGSALRLPPWYEERRTFIEKRLPPIERRTSPAVSE